MIVHIVLGCVVSIMGICAYRKGVSKSSNKTFVIAAFFAVFLVQALRSSAVGLDTYRYYVAFSAIKAGHNTRFEIGYIYLNKLIALFTDNAQWLFPVCALLTDVGIAFFIIKNTDNDECAFFAVFTWITLSSYLNSMNLTRQAIAISITVNAYSVLKFGKKNIRFLYAGILIVIASMFHSMAIVAVLIFVPFLLKRISRRSIVITAIICVLMLPFFEYLINLVVLLIPRYSYYLTSWRIQGTEGVGGYYILLSIVKILLVAAAFALDDRKESNKEIYFLSFFTVISVGFYLLKTKVSLALRTGYFFEPFTFLLFPKILRRMRMHRGQRFILFVGMYAVFFTLFVYMMSGGRVSSRGCVPYYFFWQ